MDASGRVSAKATERDLEAGILSRLVSFNKAASGSLPSMGFSADAAASRQAFSWPLQAAMAARPMVSTVDGDGVTVFATASADAAASSVPRAEGLASQSGSAARMGDMR